MRDRPPPSQNRRRPRTAAPYGYGPPDPNRSAYLPRAPVWRRGAATAIDGLLVWMVSSILGAALHTFAAIVFFALWFALRVVMVANNRGQSPGRLAMDIKVLDGRSRRIPTFLDLTKREAIVGTALWLALMGLGQLAQINPAGVLLIAPLGIDYAAAIADTDQRAALHDRPIGSVIIQTQRGFSLDLKVRRWYQLLRDRSDRFMRK